MNIKTATKTVRDEITKLKSEVSSWVDGQGSILSTLQADVNKEKAKTFSTMIQINDPKQIINVLKDFDRVTAKMVDKSTEKTVELNTKHSAIVKGISKNLGEMAKPYLNITTSSIFGVGVKSKKDINENLAQIVFEDEKELNIEKFVGKLNTKMVDVTKFITKKNSNEHEHAVYMAKIETFTTKLLSAIDADLKLSKPNKEFIDSKSIFSELIYEYQSTKNIHNIDKALTEIKNISPAQLDSLVQAYGSAPDEASLKRSKSAMKGVRESFSYFKRDFIENFIEDVDMNRMYLNDMLDHLHLGQACLKNDPAAMYDHYRMDTASRELMSDSLHTYLNSDNFFDDIRAQKKSKKKP